MRLRDWGGVEEGAFRPPAETPPPPPPGCSLVGRGLRGDSRLGRVGGIAHQRSHDPYKLPRQAWRRQAPQEHREGQLLKVASVRTERPVLWAGHAAPWLQALGTGPVHTRTDPGSRAAGWRAWAGGLPLPALVLTSEAKSPPDLPTSGLGLAPPGRVGAGGQVESGHVNQL